MPLFERFTMPPSTQDSETAALYKQLRTRALRVPAGKESRETRLLQAFLPLCAQHSTAVTEVSEAASRAFSDNWLRHEGQIETHAREGRRRFLDRFEWPSIWETKEVQDHLTCLWKKQMAGAHDSDVEHDAGESAGPVDHDACKERATVAHYCAIVARDVAFHFEGLARARVTVV